MGALAGELEKRVAREPQLAVPPLSLIQLVVGGYCSPTKAADAASALLVAAPQTTLSAAVVVEPQTTLKPVAVLAPHTTELPQTTELPETFAPQTTDEPHTTDEPQTTEDPQTTDAPATPEAVEAFPLESVTVPVDAL